GTAIIRFSWTFERWAFRDCGPAGDRHPRTIRCCSGEGYRQEHAHGSYPAALSQPRAPSLCHATAVPRLRPQAIRSPPFALHAATRAGPQSEHEFAVRLCRGHHRELHRARDERAWWKQAGIDPIKVARRLWKETHAMGERRSRREVVPRPNGAPVSSDPKNDEISATATTQDETRRGEMPENRGDVKRSRTRRGHNVLPDIDLESERV